MDKRLGTLDVDETIVINDEVHITILDIQGGQVRFGITAPAVKKVYCQVLLERIREIRDSIPIKTSLI